MLLRWPPVRLSLSLESPAPEVRYRNREIHSSVNKFPQNLHMLDMSVKAEKKSLKPRFKALRLFMVGRPGGKVFNVTKRFFILQ